MTRLVHMVGNAHIDPVWLWQWPEGYQEVRATFQSAIDRMGEYPDFVFTSTSVVFFQWVEESDPELFAQIRARIAEGRWHVIGGWWIEPDCNVPSGESFVRQALYGQRWLRERFGVTATTGANIDSFGHAATIPQLLRKAGMDSYVFLRPQPSELELPGPLFEWESPDGSRVLAYRIPHEYCAPGADLDGHVELALAHLPRDREELMVFYGVGNHGGGPTRANLDSIERLNAGGGLPRLELSTPRRFFDSVNGDLPVHAGELQHHSVGCYTAHSGIKRWNRRAESLLQRAEKWCVVADVLGAQAYPLAGLTEAWKLVLLNQFHDTLGGTSIPAAYDDARDQLGHAASVAGLAFNRAVQSLSRQIAIEHEDGTVPVVVFNAHPWRVRTVAEVDFSWLTPEGARIVDDEGRSVPVQTTRPPMTMSASRGRLAFAADLPPLGWRVYRIQRGAEPATATTPEGLPWPDVRRAVVVRDESDTWSHAVRAYDDELGEFERISLRTIENGPVRAIVRVESRWGDSTLREDYLLVPGAPHVDVRVTLDWRERHRLLKLRYPTGPGRATFSIPYGHLEREAGGDEEPGQAWVSCGGLSVITDAKHGWDVRGGEIGVTAVRSPVWACHDPATLDPDQDYEYMDQGRQEFVVRLVPHAGDWREAGTVRLAAELDQPAYALLESAHDGPLPQQASFVDDGGGAVVATVVKGAEDADGSVVVRAYESTGRAAEASIELPLLGRTIEAHFDASELKTFRVPRDPGAPVVETDLLEWP
jgi:alpha-mannosidase